MLRRLLQVLREWSARLALGGASPDARDRARRPAPTHPDQLRPLGPPAALGPRASLVDASFRGDVYLLKRWTDLPPDARRELLRLIEARKSLGSVGSLPVLSAGERTLERRSGFVFCIQEHRPRTLKAWLASQGSPVALETAIGVVRQLAVTLQAAHAQSVVHGSLSPEAVFVSTREGADPGTLSVDFVRFTASDLARNPAFTIAEVFPTGRRYLAPEALLGNPPDAQSDLYVLGVIAYETLTGKSPFGESGTSATRKVREMLTATVHPISQHRNDLPPSWESAIMRLLSKDRSVRFKTAEDLLAALDTPS